MTVHHLDSEVFTEIDLRFSIVRDVELKLNDIEFEVVKCASHIVETIFRLDHDLIKTVIKSPSLLFLRQRTKESLPTPISSGLPWTPAVRPALPKNARKLL